MALIIGFLCLGAVTVPAQNTVELQKVTLHLGKTTIDTEVAATPEEGERGLMFRTKLADDAGMIFVLPVGRAHFWMKNTLIPLSIAFIDKNGVILEIHDMMPPDKDHPVPDSELPRTDSDSNQVAYALETNLHWFSLNSIKPGDKLTPAPATLIKTVAP